MYKVIHTMFHEPSSRLFFVVNTILALLTILSVLALILETVARFEVYQSIFLTIEIIAVGAFTGEYIARIAISEKKLRYLFSFFGIIDLLAVLPSYLLLTNFTFLKSARLLHVIRILRVLRVVKLLDEERPHGKRRILPEHVDMSLYFLVLSLAVIILGSFLWAAEPGNVGALNIPLAMAWVFQVILGGISPYSTNTIFGDIVIIATRFTGLLLIGLLIYAVGHRLDRLFYGKTDPTRPSPILSLRK